VDTDRQHEAEPVPDAGQSAPALAARQPLLAPAAAQLIAADTVPQPVARDKPAGWGDFEGLARNVERSPGARAAPPPSPVPARQSAARPAVSAQPTPANAHDGPLLGDSALDAFGAPEAAANLDLDYGTGAGLHPSRRSPAPQTGQRNSLAGRVGYEDRRRLETSRRRGPSALWLLPALLLLLLCVGLLAPALFSVPAADDAAALERQARNPATRSSDRRLTPARPVDLAKMPPALRELPH
jgi:hypothetical protein